GARARARAGRAAREGALARGRGLPGGGAELMPQVVVGAARPPLGAPFAAAPPPAPRDRMVRLRLMVVALSACLWALVIVVRLVQLQVMGRPEFERQAARQGERTINLDPRRGAIVDRSGHPLAVSVDAESIYAVPQDVEDAAGTAAALGRALGLDA